MTRDCRHPNGGVLFVGAIVGLIFGVAWFIRAMEDDIRHIRDVHIERCADCIHDAPGEDDDD